MRKFLLALFIFFLTVSQGFCTTPSLLIHWNGADGQNTYTAETGQVVTFVATAQLDTAIKYFGSASLMLDGNSDWNTLPDSALWNLGTGNFTIDFWWRINTLKRQPFVSQVDGVNDAIDIEHSGAGGTIDIAIKTTAGWRFLCSWSWNPLNNTWYHIAIVRSGTGAQGTKVYVDGTSLGNGTLNLGAWDYSVPDLGGVLRIGDDTGWNGNHLDGFMDEFRWIKGSAEWTSNFSKPTQEYSLSSGQLIGVIEE